MFPFSCLRTIKSVRHSWIVFDKKNSPCSLSLSLSLSLQIYEYIYPENFIRYQNSSTTFCFTLQSFPIAKGMMHSYISTSLAALVLTIITIPTATAQSMISTFSTMTNESLKYAKTSRQSHHTFVQSTCQDYPNTLFHIFLLQTPRC